MTAQPKSWRLANKSTEPVAQVRTNHHKLPQSAIAYIEGEVYFKFENRESEVISRVVVHEDVNFPSLRVSSDHVDLMANVFCEENLVIDFAGSKFQ